MKSGRRLDGAIDTAALEAELLAAAQNLTAGGGGARVVATPIEPSGAAVSVQLQEALDVRLVTCSL